MVWQVGKTVCNRFPPRPPDDAWIMLARLALAFKTNNRECANNLLDKLLARYKTGAPALYATDLPEGDTPTECRPYSEDELILAVSGQPFSCRKAMISQVAAFLDAGLAARLTTLSRTH